MKMLKPWMMLVMAFILGASGLLSPGGRSASAATNDYVSVTKTVYPSQITTEQEATVSLGIKGTPPANVIVPNDVILIIDKSGSMAPSYNNGEDKMTNAKEAAKGFIDLMDMTKHRVGIVDFSSINMIGSFDLTTDKTAAKNYINTIQANGSTSTGDAIQKAMDLLANHRPEAQPVIVLLTDGDATYPTNDPYGYAKSKAMAAKDAGIIFYTIALLKQTDNPDTSGPNILLKEMATTADHHHFVLGSTGLSDIYAAIVKEIGLASAFNVQVKDVVSPDFEIVPGSYDDNIPKPTVTGNTLTWTFNELKDKTLTFTYKIRPVDKNKRGTFATSTADSVISYKDYAGASRTKSIPSADLTITFPAPTITSIVDSSGPPAGGNTVTITGTNFKAGATVNFDSTPATSVQVMSATQITATVPAGNQGTVTVTVKNPDNQKATTQYQYKIDPVITSITPNNGELAGGTVVAISGNYFMTGASVKFGDQPAAVTMNNGSTLIKVTAPAATTPGPVNVVLTNPDGTSTTVTGGYTYNEPPKKALSVTSVSPNSGLTAGGDIVYVNGANIDPAVKIYFGDNQAPLLTYYSDARVKVSVPAATSAGAVAVKLVNPDGTTATLDNGYTYTAPPALPAPKVTSLDTTSGLLAGGYTLFVNGENFQTGVKIYFGSVQGTVSTYYSANRLKVVVPAATVEGPVDVRAVNPDGQEGTLTSGFTYVTPPPPPPPTISALTPNNGPVAGSTIVYIDGTGFVSGLKVYFGDAQATVNTYYSDLRLKVTSPAGPAAGGAVDVKIVNPDGQQTTLTGGYTYTVPAPEPVTVTGLTPNTGLLTGGELIYIDGTNLKAGATVKFGNKTVSLAGVVSSTRVKVNAPAGDAVGPVDVTYTNPDGQTFTLTNGYTYTAPVPTITGLSPNHGDLAGGTIVYIDGTNFDPNMTVKMNGKTLPILTYYNSTRIKISTPAATVAGQVPIVITLPSGNSVSTNYTYDAPPALPAPSLTTLSVTSGPLAGGGIMYIDGANFVSGLKVYFGGKEATLLTYYGSTRLKVSIPAGTAAGAVDVKVVNPDGQVSNALTYTYQ